MDGALTLKLSRRPPPMEQSSFVSLSFGTPSSVDLLISVSWSTYSGDIETRKATTTYTLGSGLESQQVGNVWSAPDTIVSLSFTGELNVFDRRTAEKPVKVLYVSPLLPVSPPSVPSSSFS